MGHKEAILERILRQRQQHLESSTVSQAQGLMFQDNPQPADSRADYQQQPGKGQGLAGGFLSSTTRHSRQTANGLTTAQSTPNGANHAAQN